MTYVRLPVADLAECLGSNPEDVRSALGLAERLGAVRLCEGRVVELPAAAVARLGLARDAAGRWYLKGGDVLRVAPGKRRRRVVPLLFPEATADRKAAEPWAALAEAEGPPPDRVAAIRAWLARQASAPPPEAPKAVCGAAAVACPGPTPAPPQFDGPGRGPALGRPGPKRKKKPWVKPVPARNSFDRKALRDRLDATGRVAS